MPIDRWFSGSYTEARERFLRALDGRGARINSAICPRKGPAGEPLYIDTAQIGSADCKRHLIVLSGTHGVEGFCGSACQVAWLLEDAESLPADMCITLVHALNPYGFAWLRRVNEDNVDLNRNFVAFDGSPLQTDPGYRELEPLLNPRELDASSIGKVNPQLIARLQTEADRRRFTAIVGKGQYEFPKGIIFGGSSPAWSNGVLRSLVHSLLQPEIACVLDIHTGLGPTGHLSVFTEERGGKFDRIRGWLSGYDVSSLGTPDPRNQETPDPLGYKITGSTFQAFTAADASTPWYCMALEFGTHPVGQVLAALQADNWLHCMTDGSHPLAPQVQSLMKNAFLLEADEWQESVVKNARDVIAKVIVGMRSVHPGSI